MRIAVLASGRGSNMEALLDAQKDGHMQATISLVVSDQPDAPCLQKAQAAGVPATLSLPATSGEKRADYDARLIALLQEEAPDLIVLAGFMRILSPAFCEAFAGRIINIHPALLPSFKGAHGIRDTLAAGAKLAGCTTHFVTAELDGGPQILQAAVPVLAGDDQSSLAARVLHCEHWLLPRTVHMIATGQARWIKGAVEITPTDSWLGAFQKTHPDVDALFSQGF